MQVTKPEKRVEAMDSSQSEGEEPEAKARFATLVTNLGFDFGFSSYVLNISNRSYVGAERERLRRPLLPLKRRPRRAGRRR